VRHLDGHQPLQLFVAGQVDPAEAALAQQPLDTVAADVRQGLTGEDLASRGMSCPSGSGTVRTGSAGLLMGASGQCRAVVCATG
jgi:hypothetical protein